MYGFKSVFDEVYDLRFKSRFKCCYCEKSHLFSKDITVMSSGRREALRNWVDILGGTFQKNIIGLKQITICRSHFKETWTNNRPLDLLPFADLGRPDVIQEDQYMKMKMKSECGHLSHKCAYCGKVNKLMQMTTVPTNEFVFNKWVAILGDEFRKNVENCERNISAICRTHFDVQFRQRPPSLLPKSMETPEKQEKSVKIEEKEKKDEPNMLQCCYCSEIRNNLTEMIQTPKDTKGLLRWSDILGPIFYGNYMKRKNRYICVEHLKKGSKRIFNDEIMEEFRQKESLKEKEKDLIPNIMKKEIEVEEKPGIEKILIEKDWEEEVKPMKFEKIKQEIRNYKVTGFVVTS
ncbi:unnamed protein product [Caenorhabditis angaria]|uniref:THAP-type domain-containing protein n=1 Tax=Caenorhabditis angaria TaxID=860376 RepID=A0A9P1IYH4_9PELO|nr:unnamed protein product [Caenorhabditis angaria]